MLPTSIAGSISIGSPPGAVSPASTVRTSISSNSKSRPGSTPIRWVSGLLAPADVAESPAIAASLMTGTLGADRADEAGRAELGLDLLGAAPGGSRRRARCASLISLRRWSPRTQDEDHAASLDDHRHRLDQGAGGHARALRRPPRPWSARASATSSGASSGGGSSTGCGSRRGDLDVGRVAGRERDLVLAGRAGRHVLVGAGAAHHPDVGLDPVPAQPAAVEDPLVGAALQLVAARRGPPRRGRSE